MDIDKFISYSQNFIKNDSLVKELISKTDLNKRDLVLDIGAGKGILSKELAKHVKKVIAIEIDSNLIPELKQNTQQFENIEVVNDDFMNYQLPKEPYKVFSNIPFNYSSKIFRKLLLSDNNPLNTYLFLQIDFWKRYAGIEKETQMSLLLKPLYEMNLIQKLKKDDFIPSPAVDAVFVEVKLRETPLIDLSKYESYKDFIVYATIQGKTNISNNLKKVITYNQMKRLSKDLKFSLKDNPMDLTINQWVGLYHFYEDNVLDDKKVLTKGYYRRQLEEEKKLEKVYRSRG